MKTRYKPSQDIADQVKDFFENCDIDGYTDSRIYSTKELMRTLQNPVWRDICGTVNQYLTKLLHNPIIDGNQDIHRHSSAEVMDLVKQELSHQAHNAAAKNNPKGNIADVDMDKIRKEYLVFLGERRQYEKAFREVKINPYTQMGSIY